MTSDPAIHKRLRLFSSDYPLYENLSPTSQRNSSIVWEIPALFAKNLVSDEFDRHCMLNVFGTVSLAKISGVKTCKTKKYLRKKMWFSFWSEVFECSV